MSLEPDFEALAKYNQSRLDEAIECGTSIIFLNQHWLSRLKEIIEENGLLTDSLNSLITNAKKENREAFNKLNCLK